VGFRWFLVGLLGLRASCGVFFGRFLWLGLRLFWVFFFFFFPRSS
jgi:hypothetical protein